jgi:hypothetical protein
LKKIITILLIALSLQSAVIAKGNKKEKQEKTFTLSNELKGFEADYLSNKDFKTKVESKKFWGLIELVVDFVASLFNSSYGKYTKDTQNDEGPYFIFDRTPNGLSLTEKLKTKTI